MSTYRKMPTDYTYHYKAPPGPQPGCIQPAHTNPAIVIDRTKGMLREVFEGVCATSIIGACLGLAASFMVAADVAPHTLAQCAELFAGGAAGGALAVDFITLPMNILIAKSIARAP